MRRRKEERKKERKEGRKEVMKIKYHIKNKNTSRIIPHVHNFTKYKNGQLVVGG